MAKAAAATAPEPEKPEAAAETPEPKEAGGKRKLILLAVPVVLLGIGAGLWFSGVAPRLLGMNQSEPTAESAKSAAPVYVDLPEMIANLNSNPRRPSYVKLTARLELAKLDDVERVHIERILRETQHNLSRAARILDIDRTTLYNKLRRYGLR